MGRTIIVGDVHGCSEELGLLLRLVKWSRRDRVLFVGDLLSRGPDPAGVLELLRETRGQAVRGNHESSLLAWKKARSKKGAPSPVGRSNRGVVGVLRGEDWKLLRSLPLYLDLPDHGIRIVHAGVIPGVPIEAQPPSALIKMRYFDDGEPVEMYGRTLWAARYVGPPHVVFGHNARVAPQIHPWATGIDTGVVYGGRLTAMVLKSGQPVPAARSRRSVLFSVMARRRYSEGDGRSG
jgi:hypothetical protein